MANSNTSFERCFCVFFLQMSTSLLYIYRHLTPIWRNYQTNKSNIQASLKQVPSSPTIIGTFVCSQRFCLMMGLWCDGTRRGMRIPRPGSNSQRVSNTTWCWPWASHLYHKSFYIFRAIFKGFELLRAHSFCIECWKNWSLTSKILPMQISFVAQVSVVCLSC